MKYCKNCGKELENEAKFCKNCGYNIETGEIVNNNKDVKISYPEHLIKCFGIGMIYFIVPYITNWICATFEIEYDNVLRDILSYIQIFFPILLVIFGPLFVLIISSICKDVQKTNKIIKVINIVSIILFLILDVVSVNI